MIRCTKRLKRIAQSYCVSKYDSEKTIAKYVYARANLYATFIIRIDHPL